MTTTVIIGDSREILPTLTEKAFHTCVTSPPYYGLRDYGVDGQIGLEPTPDEYVAALVKVFREVRRVLRDDGTVWLILGDSYASGGRTSRAGDKKLPARGSSRRPTDPAEIKPKDLIGIPWMVAFALRADGWYLRQDIIWSKPNPMPESVTDRCTKAHEYIFLLSKRARYFFDADAIREPSVCDRLPGRGMTDTRETYGAQSGGNSGLLALRNKLNDQGETDGTRNRRSVWTVTTQPFKDAHFATFPPKLIEPCILAGCPIGGRVLDPFGGAGTTGLVADRLQRNATLIELNPEYAAMADGRIYDDAPLFAGNEHTEQEDL